MKHLFLFLTLLNVSQATYTASEENIAQELCNDGTVACGISTCCLTTTCLGIPIIDHQSLMIIANTCATRAHQQSNNNAPLCLPMKKDLAALALSGSLPCCIPSVAPYTGIAEESYKTAAHTGAFHSCMAFCIIPLCARTSQS
jgi:hypothetical protein